MSVTSCNIDGCDRPKRASNGMCGVHYQRWRRLGSTELTARVRYEYCTVDGCGRQADRVTIGLCEAHYGQERRNGQITSVEVKPHRGGPGNFAPAVPCKEPGCDKNADARGWCPMHYARYRRHGDPQTVVNPTRAMGADHASWRGNEAGYTAVHDRIRRRRGSASRHDCLHCGNQARHWAYDHSDPDGLMDDMYGPYSTDSERYMPLCVPCHKRFDLDYLALAKGSQDDAQGQ